MFDGNRLFEEKLVQRLHQELIAVQIDEYDSHNQILFLYFSYAMAIFQALSIFLTIIYVCNTPVLIVFYKNRAEDFFVQQHHIDDMRQIKR